MLGNFIFGSILFAAGMLGNMHSDSILRNLRKPGESGYKIPFGEAESHWTAAVGLDNRYRQRDWLLQIRRWPPQPTADLMDFLDLLEAP